MTLSRDRSRSFFLMLCSLFVLRSLWVPAHLAFEDHCFGGEGDSHFHHHPHEHHADELADAGHAHDHGEGAAGPADDEPHGHHGYGAQDACASHDTAQSSSPDPGLALADDPSHHHHDPAHHPHSAIDHFHELLASRWKETQPVVPLPWKHVAVWSLLEPLAIPAVPDAPAPPVPIPCRIHGSRGPPSV